MDITFNKVGELWEAEFEATADFAIHLERDKVGVFRIYQRTAGSKYALVDEVDKVYTRNVGTVDYECPSLIYPKFIKVVSGTEPTLAEIVTDGEVTEIKAQAKEIEVTTNGTTEVIPDSGFAYLSKVNIKTNVPQSGEGGGGSTGGGEGGSGGGSNIEYIRQEDANVFPMDQAKIGAQFIKIKFNNQTLIGPAGLLLGVPADMVELVAFGIDFNAKMISSNASMTIKESLMNYGITEDQLAAIPRITEEEFYNLNA